MKNITEEPQWPRFSLGEIRRRMARILKCHPGWLAEFNLLLDRAEDDCRMAVARARILLEWVVAENYSVVVAQGPPRTTLHQQICRLSRCPDVSPVFVSLAHRVRMDGNAALHYDHELGKLAEITQRDSVSSAARIAELVERALTGEWSVYSSAIEEPFQAVYKHYVGTWRAILAGKKGRRFQLFGVLDLLLRGILAQMPEICFDLLVKYRENGALPKQLPAREERALRTMRNLGLIRPDGEWLFTPKRSTSVTLLPRGEVMLALLKRQGPPSPGVEAIAREVEADLARAISDHNLLDALRWATKTETVDRAKIDVVRRLRNMALVAHSAPLLAGSRKVALTELGSYVLGQATPDPK